MMERLSPIFISDAFLQDMALGGIILSCIFNMFIRGQNSGVVTEPEGPYPLHCTRETNILGRMSGGRGGGECPDTCIKLARSCFETVFKERSQVKQNMQ